MPDSELGRDTGPSTGSDVHGRYDECFPPNLGASTFDLGISCAQGGERHRVRSFGPTLIWKCQQLSTFPGARGCGKTYLSARSVATKLTAYSACVRAHENPRAPCRNQISASTDRMANAKKSKHYSAIAAFCLVFFAQCNPLSWGLTPCGIEVRFQLSPMPNSRICCFSRRYQGAEKRKRGRSARRLVR